MIQHIPASERFHRDEGWLRTYWLFSFDDYYDPANVHFGALRVFNDDVIQPGGGFPMHQHRDAEVVTIPLSGALTHTDNMGHRATIEAGEVQRMSAGTGVRHSEVNEGDMPVHLYQIWFQPRALGTPPSYAQRRFNSALWHNRLAPLVSGQGMPDTLDVGADITLFRAAFTDGHMEDYHVRPGRGVFIYPRGILHVNDVTLAPGDQARITEVPVLRLQADGAAEFILIDVPM